jgi:superfamily II DNA or RNA helicase
MTASLTLPQLALRPYQQAALDAIAAAELRDVRRQVVSLPTGAGKTVIFSHLIAERGQRAIVLVHRDELITQTIDKLTAIARRSAADIGVVKAERDEHAGDIVVASVQTLQRAKRLQRLAQTFGVLVVDECHHALPDNGYGRILAYLGAYADDGPLTVGFTATPFRPNNNPIADGTAQTCFDEVTYTLPLPWMIEQGYLTPVIGKQLVLADLDLRKVRTQHGDYVERDLEAALLAANAPEHLVSGYRDHAQGRRAIIFCPTVKVVTAVEVQLRMHGFRVAAIVGETEREARQRHYAALRAGQLDALVSCMVLTEGFDEPSVDCVVIARPTKSKVLFVQAIGRGLRPCPQTGKTDCLLLDCVAATDRHGLLSLAAQLGLLRKSEAEGAAPEEARTSGAGEGLELDGAYHVRDIDLMRREPLHWVETPKGYWVVVLREQTLRIRPEGNDRYRLEVHTRGEQTYRTLAEQLPLDYCFGIGSDTAKDAGLLPLVRVGASWRTRPPSEKQLAYARKLRITIPPHWNAGELGDAIARVTGDWYDAS